MGVRGHHIGHIGPMRLMRLMGLMGPIGLMSSCIREPELHLYDEVNVAWNMPLIDLNLDVYWDYEIAYGIDYDWQAEWWYGWDDTDRSIFGEIGYTEPSVFNLRRYYTNSEPYAAHTSVLRDVVYGNTFRGRFQWGYWDLLAWNQVQTIDGVQSLVFDETTSLDEVTARTGPSMVASRYEAPLFTQAFYEPEPLFAAYDRAEHISEDLEGFTYDAARGVWSKTLKMQLMPVTYIYLTQVILHNNHGRVTGVDGTSRLSGMARSVCLNTGIAGQDAITVYYSCRFKKDCDKDGETVDIIGGRVMTFGIVGSNPNMVTRADEVNDGHNHYMDVTMLFNNGTEKTMAFDVTDQVKKRYKGGVITVELDVDDIEIPQREGGSGFDAVVKDTEDGGTYEFDM